MDLCNDQPCHEIRIRFGTHALQTLNGLRLGLRLEDCPSGIEHVFRLHFQNPAGFQVLHGDTGAVQAGDLPLEFLPLLSNADSKDEPLVTEQILCIAK